MNDAERFWSKVNKDGPVPAHRPELGPCWVWTASVGSHGYGQLSFGGIRVALAHRVAFFLAEGRWALPFTLHHCDNRPCVRRSHLFEGTSRDNVVDMVAKGRHARAAPRGDASGSRLHPERLSRGDAHYSRREPHRLARGERSGQTRMTVALVVELRLLRAQGWPLKDLAARYGISLPAVSAIAHRRNWAHVP